MNDRTTAREPRPADPHPRLRLAALIAVALGVVLLAAAAFVFSYGGIHQIARAAGVSPSLARVYPLIFDAMLVVAFAAALGLRGARWWTRCYVWLCTLVLLAAVAAGDAVRAMGVDLPRKPSAAAVAVIPWTLLLIAFGFLLAMLRQLRRARLAANAAAADAAGAAGAVPGNDHPGHLDPAGGSEPGQGLDIRLGARPAGEAPSLGGKLAARPQPAAGPGIRPQAPPPARRPPADVSDGTAPGSSRHGNQAAGDSAHGQIGVRDGAHGQDEAGDSTHQQAGPMARAAGDGAPGQAGATASDVGDGAHGDGTQGDGTHGDNPARDSADGKGKARGSAQEDSDGAAADDEAKGTDDPAAAVEDCPENPAPGDEEAADGEPGLPLPAPPAAPFDRLHSTPSRPQE